MGRWWGEALPCGCGLCEDDLEYLGSPTFAEAAGGAVATAVTVGASLGLLLHLLHLLDRLLFSPRAAWDPCPRQPASAPPATRAPSLALLPHTCPAVSVLNTS
eukprot:COSAG01_NODE_959_length_12451_cov_18.389815_8_plen_103_part_00